MQLLLHQVSGLYLLRKINAEVTNLIISDDTDDSILPYLASNETPCSVDNNLFTGFILIGEETEVPMSQVETDQNYTHTVIVGVQWVIADCYASPLPKKYRRIFADVIVYIFAH